MEKAIPTNYDFDDKDEKVEVPVTGQEVHFDRVRLPVSYFFQPKPTLKVDLSRLRLTNVSLYSTTPHKEANFVSRAIANFFRGGRNDPFTLTETTPKGSLRKSASMGTMSLVSSPITITDATAHIGGNTISFGLNGFKVNAVEKDPMTYEILKHNMGVYGLPTDNTICADYLEVYKTLRQDVLYLDPPWGKRYKEARILDLYLGQTNIADLCADIMGNPEDEAKPQLASLIVLKLPANYNLPNLIAKMPNRTFLTHKVIRGNGRHSYNIIFCWWTFSPCDGVAKRPHHKAKSLTKGLTPFHQ